MTGPAVTLPPEAVIEALRVTDAARCAALEEVLFPGDEPWSAGAFREELRAGHTYLAARIETFQALPDREASARAAARATALQGQIWTNAIAASTDFAGR